MSFIVFAQVCMKLFIYLKLYPICHFRCSKHSRKGAISRSLPLSRRDFQFYQLSVQSSYKTDRTIIGSCKLSVFFVKVYNLLVLCLQSGAIMAVLGYVCTQYPDTKLGIIFLPFFVFSAGSVKLFYNFIRVRLNICYL